MKIILPVIRDIEPNVIASQLIGVQNMMAPVGNIFSLKPVFYPSAIKLSKVHYGHFLRLYNRRKIQDPEYITNQGYPNMKVSRREDKSWAAKDWCDKHLKHGSYIYHNGKFWFACDIDYTLFLLRWS
jgi:hypothetical protein